MKKNTVYAAILVAAVVIAVIFSVRLFLRDSAEGDAAQSVDGLQDRIHPPVTEAENTAPQDTAGPETAPEPSETPSPAPTETPAPSPSPAPTETPAPSPTSAPVSAETLSSGVFISETQTQLNLRADWSLYTDTDGERKLRVDLSITSYSFRTNALPNSLELNVNGERYTANSPAVDYDGEDLKITPMAGFTVPAPAGDLHISAVWHYNGSYNGKDLAELTAEGTVDG